MLHYAIVSSRTIKDGFRSMRVAAFFVLLVFLVSAPLVNSYNPPPGRRFVALPLDEGRVFFSWRYRETDGLQCHYEVKRAEERTGPYTMAGIFREGEGTCFIDSTAVSGKTYYCYTTTPSGMSRVLEVMAMKKGPGCISFPLDDGYIPYLLALGDLDGDMLFEIVVLSVGSTIGSGSMLVEAFSVEGGRLWRVPLPKLAVSEGPDPGLLVLDLNGDGMDEIVVGSEQAPVVLEPSSGVNPDMKVPPGMVKALQAAIRGGEGIKAVNRGIPSRSLELEWDGADGPELAADGKIFSTESGKSLGVFLGTPVTAADILGDWRDEMITVDEGAIRIYTSAIPINVRRLSPLDDLGRRAAIGRGRLVAGIVTVK
jgi:hypothetical protein